MPVVQEHGKRRVAYYYDGDYFCICFLFIQKIAIVFMVPLTLQISFISVFFSVSSLFFCHLFRHFMEFI